jgi:glycosyltransferase involved in cell wall biosynthesis
MKTAVFTIVSLNYGAFAKTLMESLQATHPDWERHVLFVDQCDDFKQIGGELFNAMGVEALPLPNKREFLFRYDIMEMNTAAKPYMFAHLRRQGYDRVLYIDPDILVVDRLADVERLLDEGAAAVVTPHLTAPLDDGRNPTELDIMQAGAYNLGFLALNSLPASDAFIQWWEQKLEHGAINNKSRGLFTDQKWVDLAPGMFGGFAVLRDPGYNVAYWNLPHRPVTTQDGKWFAGGQPLRFFHFSGFDPLNPAPFSKHQDRLTLDTIGPARELALEYARRVSGHGLAADRSQPYAFGRFADGTSIPTMVRAMYRESDEVRAKAGPDPFAAADFFIHGDVAGMPLIMRGAWLHFDHLKRAFPDPMGNDRLAYREWFAEYGKIEFGVPDAFIAPLRLALKDFNRFEPVPGAGVDKVSIWGRLLITAHLKATGGKLGHPRLRQYQQVTGPISFFKLGFAQFRGSRWARKVGLDLPYKAELDPMLAGPSGSHGQVHATRRATGAQGQLVGVAAAAVGVNLVGYARSEHGVGQSLRQCASALDAASIAHDVIDFNNNNTSRVDDRSLDARIVTDASHAINVFHINADQMHEVAGSLPALLSTRYNVGFWHWEMPDMLDEHKSGFAHVDEVWVPSGFVQEAIAKSSPVPVVRMPHAIQFTVSPEASRKQFGLPEDTFLFLMMYDFSSYQDRKNPQAALEAFDQAFGGHGGKVALVIKTQNAQLHAADVAALQAKLAGRKDIFWINETLPRQAVYDLQSVCDALLSLHRSEGYGLGPAEAMFLGKPVIATNWSGNTEFMRQDNSLPVNYKLVKLARDIGVYKAGQTWAEPDVAHAASLMQQVVADPALRARIAKEAKRTMVEEFSPAVIGQRIRARLAHIQHTLQA